jgi:hypothetical protein
VFEHAVVLLIIADRRALEDQCHGSKHQKRNCTHKIAIGDSDLSSPLWPTLRTKSDTSRGPRSAITGREQAQQEARLFDHLVGTQQDRCPICLSRSPCSLQIYDELELRWLFNRRSVAHPLSQSCRASFDAVEQRLIREVTDRSPIRARVGKGHLDHHDPNKLLGRVYPKRRPERAGPVKSAD